MSVAATSELSGHDAAYVYWGSTPTIATVVSCIAVASDDGRPLVMTRADVHDWIRPRLAISDLFTSRLRRLPGDIGMPYWERTEIDLDHHVTLHEPGRTWPETRSLLASIADAPTDFDRPLWSLDVIPEVVGHPDQPDPVTVMAIGFHHASIDGMSMSAVISALSMAEPPAAPVHRLIGDVSVAHRRRVMTGLLRVPGAWLRLLGATPRVIRDQRRAARAGTVLRHVPRTRFNTGFTGPRETDAVRFPLADVQVMKASVPGATVNTTMLSIIGEAVSEYLDRHGEPCDTLSALVPKSLRGPGAENSTAGANQFVPMFIDLAVGERDLSTRLALIGADSDREKARVAREAQHSPVGLLHYAPSMLLRWLGRRSDRQIAAPAAVFAHIIVSNVYNPNSARSMMGHPIVGGFGIQPLTGLSTLAHAVVTRGDVVAMSITTDGAVMPDLARYCDLLRASFARHRAALVETEHEQAG
ncbi:wax ester/triacylglycerol synthase domain-containing protein [Williamsia sterculiae]|uniref:diacylglycerol O-acyltransferase n=1 Tax=Williamsia sterculiae TaxID=1344003 RepID=A0A1N7GQG1_9NOCA|nr:wax ester/triacylglycerol synthase domain-containing protein [Williamsia sterculiae]SIS14824.1 acyltransferase, WS/DGAT/MGAT [Williamsia sterculiae]